MYIAFARHGTLAIPWELGYLGYPNSGLEFLQSFVTEFDDQHILRANNANLPHEIHFLLRGTAGFGVDLRGWGNWEPGNGFIRKLIEYDDSERLAGRNVNIFERVYIVAMLEPNVVNGLAPWSIQPNTDYTQPPQRFFHGFQSEYAFWSFLKVTNGYRQMFRQV